MCFGQNTTINIKNSPWMGLAQLGMGFGMDMIGGGQYSGLGMNNSLFSMMGGGYGSFGSLTGLGYGYGGYGGYGGSLAGLGGFGYCEYSTGLNDLLATITTSVCGVGMYAINQYFSGGGGSKAKAPKLSISERIDNLETKANKQLKVLNKDGGDYTLKSINSGDNNTIKESIMEKYNDNLKTASDRIEEEMGYIDSDIAELEKSLGNRPTKENSPECTTDEALEKKRSAWKAKKEKIDKLYAEKAILDEKTDTSNALVKAFLKAKNAQEARETAVVSALEALAEIKADYEDLEEAKANAKDRQTGESLQKQLKKADGNSISRMIGGDKEIQSALCKFAKAQKKYMNGKGNADEVINAYTELKRLSQTDAGKYFDEGKNTEFSGLLDKAKKWCENNNIIKKTQETD